MALTQLMRIHRPEVVIASRNVDDQVINAVRAAADKQQFPDLITDNGLVPWEVGRTLLLTNPGSNFDVSVGGSQYLVHEGKLLADAVAQARAIVSSKSLAGTTRHLTTVMTSSRASRWVRRSAPVRHRLLACRRHHVPVPGLHPRRP